jgi:hypothetical protein
MIAGQLVLGLDEQLAPVSVDVFADHRVRGAARQPPTSGAGSNNTRR